MIRLTSLLYAVMLISACSNKQIYEGIQSNRLATCDNEEPNANARAECRRTLDHTYDTYQQERKKLLRRGIYEND